MTGQKVINLPRTSTITRWYSWVAQLWSQAEEAWLGRDGQDSYYRHKVVVPALVKELQQFTSRQQHIIDLGAGDGKFTAALLEVLNKIGFDIRSIHLLDRSSRQLRRALTNKRLNNAHTYRCEFADENWPALLADVKHPRTVLSIFVIQELSDLRCFGNALSRILGANSIVFIVTVAPTFSYLLLKKGNIKLVDSEEYPEYRDWKWAGEYPIDGESGMLFLPHFHRTNEMICNCLNESGLEVVKKRYLAVPKIKEAKGVFSETVYGNLILRIPSSMLLVVRPMNT